MHQPRSRPKDLLGIRGRRLHHRLQYVSFSVPDRFAHSLRLTAIVADDTCEGIAKAHNVNTTLLHENNPQIDPECSNIYIGEVLCVATKVIVPPPAATDKSFPTPPNASPPVPVKTPEPTVDTPKPDEGDDDYDDEDLPWCDEL